jgi:predicted Rdx family selenoprotein
MSENKWWEDQTTQFRDFDIKMLKAMRWLQNESWGIYHSDYDDGWKLVEEEGGRITILVKGQEIWNRLEPNFKTVDQIRAVMREQE